MMVIRNWFGFSFHDLFSTDTVIRSLLILGSNDFSVDFAQKKLVCMDLSSQDQGILLSKSMMIPWIEIGTMPSAWSSKTSAALLFHSSSYSSSNCFRVPFPFNTGSCFQQIQVSSGFQLSGFPSLVIIADCPTLLVDVTCMRYEPYLIFSIPGIVRGSHQPVCPTIPTGCHSAVVVPSFAALCVSRCAGCRRLRPSVLFRQWAAGGDEMSLRTVWEVLCPS
jgi:hypothetical protein